MSDVEQFTSGASNRIIPLLRSLKTPLILLQSMILYVILFLFPRRRRSRSPIFAPEESTARISKRKLLWRREEEDALRRRALAEGLKMGLDADSGDGECICRWSTSLFNGVRGNALFCRSWFPAASELKIILIIIHGLCLKLLYVQSPSQMATGLLLFLSEDDTFISVCLLTVGGKLNLQGN